MKKLMTMLLGLAFLTGTMAFAQAPAQTDQPKAEKGGKKGKAKATKKAPKKKAEEPKAQ